MLRAALPPYMHDHVLAAAAKYKHLDKSGISRAQFIFDAAVLRVFAERFDMTEMQIFVWADASPQRNVGEMFLTELLMVRKSDIELCCQRAWELANIKVCTSGPSRFQINHNAIARWARLTREVEGYLLRHVCVPQFLGSGASSLTYKAKCVVFLMYLMSREPRLLSLLGACRNVVSFTSDMGTELGLADFECTMKDILPPWVLGQAESGDGQLSADLGFDLATIADSAGGVDPAVASAKIFGLAMPIAGMMHIIHNLSWFVDCRLSHFPEWLKGMTSLVTLLHYEHNRRRYVISCVRGSDFSGRANSINRVGVPLFTEWRWGSVITVIHKLAPLECVLRNTFSAEKFKRGEDGEGEGSAVVLAQEGHGGQDRPNAAALAEHFIRSGMHRPGKDWRTGETNMEEGGAGLSTRLPLC
eukprot:2587916-Pyramimonas_sp.AAC.1